MQRGWKLPFLCILLVTGAGTHVNQEDSGPTTGKPPDDPNTTLSCPLRTKTRRLNLPPGKYEILTDGRLLMWYLSFNSTSYFLGGDGSAVVCLPLRERSPFVVPVYIAGMLLFFHAQVPLYALGVRSLNSWGFMGCAVFVYAALLAYVDAPDCDLPECPSDASAAFWYGLPPYLSVSAVHVSGALTFLHSDRFLASQVEAAHVLSTIGTDSMKGFTFSGLATFLSTCALIFAGVYDLSNSHLRYLNSLTYYMSYFLPSCLSYFVVISVFNRLEPEEPPEAISGNEWRSFRDRYQTFCIFFVATYANYGIASMMVDIGDLWESILIFAFSYSFFQCCYRSKNSHRVGFTTSVIRVKALVKKAEVLTVSSEKSEKTDKSSADRKMDLMPNAPDPLQSPPAVKQTLPVQIQNLPV